MTLQDSIVSYLEAADKSVPVYCVASEFDLPWDRAKELLEQLWIAQRIDKLRVGRYCRTGYTGVEKALRHTNAGEVARG